MSTKTDLILAALAPVIWGTTYIVATQMLPPDYPLTAAFLRALPAGLLLLLITRQLPPRNWIVRLLILGALNFTIFWAALFVAASHLPGGVAATLAAIQPLIVLGLSRIILHTPLSYWRFSAALAGIFGVGLLVLGPNAALSPVGTISSLLAALSMACGVVMTRKWQPPVPALTFTAWQLTAGGILLLPLVLVFEPTFPMPSLLNIVGYVWLGLIGAALTYFIWFRAIARLGPAAVTNLGFLSPLTAVLLGWAFLGETLSSIQILGAVIILACVFLSSRKA